MPLSGDSPMCGIARPPGRVGPSGVWPAWLAATAQSLERASSGLRDDDLARMAGGLGLVEHEPRDRGARCAVREEPASGRGEGQGASAAVVGLVGEEA